MTEVRLDPSVRTVLIVLVFQIIRFSLLLLFIYFFFD